jgi:hypothetical protein
MSSLLYPINLDSDIKNTEFDDGSILRTIDSKDLDLLFGVKTRTFDSRGNLTSCTSNHNKQIPYVVDMLESMQLIACNYIFEGTNESASVFNSTIRLWGKGNSGLWIGGNGRVWYLASRKPYCKAIPYGITKIGKSETRIFHSFFYNVRKMSNDKIFKLISEKFCYSTSGEDTPLENRLVDFITILESLFMPDSNMELSFKLSIRVAKLLHKELKMTEKELFQEMKKLYDIRSTIVHKGSSIKLNNETLMMVSEIARNTIVKYVTNKDLFTEEKLNELLFK